MLDISNGVGWTQSMVGWTQYRDGPEMVLSPPLRAEEDSGPWSMVELAAELQSILIKLAVVKILPVPMDGMLPRGCS